MSLNSLQDDMSRRAASMAAMAKRASNPQEIQAIQQRLVAGVQNGTIQPYVGIPLIQDLSKKMIEAKAKMAQSIAGAGMPQPPQGGAPIAQQVMAQAAQEDRGVETLPSNLPQSYTGGGIIAFEGGGKVERYQNAGLVAGVPSWMQWVYANESPAERARREQLESEAQTRAQQSGTLPPTPIGNFTRPGMVNDPRITGSIPPQQGVGMEAERARNMAIVNAPAPTPTSETTPSAVPGGGFNFKMPTLAGMRETAAPTLTDYDTITKNLPTKLQEASEKAVKATQSQLEEFDKPLEAKGARLESREAQLAKDSEISRWLSVIKGGLATMGGTSKFAAENIGKGLGIGIDEAIRGEAANRAAKEKLETAKDNLDDQRIAAKKGNYQAAQAAGNRAADDLRQSTQLTMTGAHYGNTEALNRYQTQQQGEFQKASLQQSGALGIAGLGLQAQQLAQTGAYQQRSLDMMQKRYDAMDKQAQARMQQVRATAFGKFNETVAPQLNAQLTSQYGKNWRTAQDPRSLQAQTLFKQAQNAYILEALGQQDASMNARSAEGLLGLGE